MSLLIKGMEMPKRGHTITITIVGSGQAYVEYFDCRPHVEETIEHEAVPVPAHGRLIDADALMKELEIDDLDDRTGAALLMAVFLEVLKSAPTIIPAEPCNNLSKPCKEDEA